MSRLLESRTADARGARRTGSGFSRLLPSSRPEAQPISLADGDAPTLWKLLASVVDSGAAVMVSKTSDGGAISLTLYVGSQRYREYAQSLEMLEQLLREAGRAAEAADGS